MRKIILVDLDGTLCKGEHWRGPECREAKPYPDMIQKVNELYKREFVVIYTARQDYLIEPTIDWLRRNNVKFHAISNNKMPADYYVDDKSIRPEEIGNL